jgi:hypothetical protein
MDVVEIIAPVYPDAIVVLELDQIYTRDSGVMNAGQAATQFAVLGFNASGVSPLTPGATDGTQNAAAVAVAPSDSSGNVVYWARGPVVLRQDMLVWPVGITAPQQADALAQLTALGLVSRVTG